MRRTVSSVQRATSASSFGNSSRPSVRSAIERGWPRSPGPTQRGDASTASRSLPVATAAMSRLSAQLACSDASHQAWLQISVTGGPVVPLVRTSSASPAASASSRSREPGTKPRGAFATISCLVVDGIAA